MASSDRRPRGPVKNGHLIAQGPGAAKGPLVHRATRIRTTDVIVKSALPAAAVVACLLVAVAARAEPAVPSQAEWDAHRQRVTTADGLTLAFVELGTGEGLPLILLHGYTDNSRIWSLPAPWLGDRPILALNLRGHGASDAPACCYGADPDPLGRSGRPLQGCRAGGAARGAAQRAVRERPGARAQHVLGGAGTDRRPHRWLPRRVRNRPTVRFREVCRSRVAGLAPKPPRPTAPSEAGGTRASRRCSSRNR